MQFTYRTPIPSDAAQLSLLLKSVYIHTYAIKGVTTEFTQFTTEQFSEERILQMIASEKEDLMVAFYNDNPIGIAKVEYHKTSPVGNVVGALLDKLYVLNHFFGKGVGHQLLEKVENIAKEKGEKEIWLWVYIKNDRAINFYYRQNYKHIGNADFVVKENSYPNKILLKQL